MENSRANQTYNAGDLVWILRRNGTRWPGQVIKPSELHEGSSGLGKLPVKLLGQEPASENVGCYDLEGVKPFRSKEFNLWIRLATLPSAYRLSSARDFAIREALEIERVRQLSDERAPTNAKNELERGPNDSCLNQDCVPIDDTPTREEQGANEDCQQKNKRQRRRRADDLLGGVGIELRTSGRNRKMLPHAREFLENIRNKRQRLASKKLKASSRHAHSNNDEYSKNETLMLDRRERSSPGCANSQKAVGSVAQNDQKEADDDHSSDSDDNGGNDHRARKFMRSRAAEFPWNWITRMRRNLIMPKRSSSQACVPVKSAFIRLMKDLD